MVLSLSALAFDPTKPQNFQFKPKEKSTKKSSKQPLTGIIKKDKKYVAILDGDVYRTGDIYRGGRITRITRTYVQLSGDQGSRRLTLIANLRSK